MLCRIMFVLCKGSNLKTKHTDVELQPSLLITQLRDAWHSEHPAVPFFHVAVFIRRPNGLFKLVKDHRV
jgi:hypothetical protein